MTRARDELILSHAADYGGARARRVSPFVLEALDLPVAAGVPGAGARTSTPAERLATFETSVPNPVARRRTDHRSALAQLLPDRRLPDLSAQVQVRARPAGAARPAPRDRLRSGAPQGRPDVPPSPCQGPRHERGGARRGLRFRLVERGLHESRSRGGSAGRRSGGPPPVPGRPARTRRRHPDLRGARVQLHARWRPGPRSMGPRRRRAARAGDTATTATDAAAPPTRAPTSSRRRSASSARSG